jgi:hypothetical protein
VFKITWPELSQNLIGGRMPCLYILQMLQWLPIRPRTTFKIAAHTYKVRAAAALNISPHCCNYKTPAASCGHHALAPSLFVPWTRTEIAKCASFMAAPNVWNSLSDPIDRLSDGISTLKHKLKISLFVTAFY